MALDEPGQHGRVGQQPAFFQHLVWDMFKLDVVLMLPMAKARGFLRLDPGSVFRYRQHH